MRPQSFAGRALGVLAAFLLTLLSPLPALSADAPLRLRVVGGLAGLNQYTQYEEPFWSRELPRLSGGTLTADIVPFDRAGIRGQEVLRLAQLGVVPFATALLSLSATQDPELGAPDLAGLNGDIATLSRSAAAFRPYLQKMLRERYGLELLAVYTYPAQVVFCNRPFAGLGDLAGRRVRTSSPSQSDLVEALRGVPIATSFVDMVPNLRSGNIECAITGTMTGHTVGLHELTTHVHSLAINWGLSAFVANSAALQALSPANRAMLRRELARLEQAVWNAAERETGEGIACNIGAPGCSAAKTGKMTEVKPTPGDEKLRRQLLASTVLPRWVQRCGSRCATVWNETVGRASGVMAKEP